MFMQKDARRNPKVLEKICRNCNAVIVDVAKTEKERKEANGQGTVYRCISSISRYEGKVVAKDNFCKYFRRY
jgi:hypothetical protein